jgi:spermidine/putrescine transport system substrate-binding protein
MKEDQRGSRRRPSSLPLSLRWGSLLALLAVAGLLLAACGGGGSSSSSSGGETGSAAGAESESESESASSSGSGETINVLTWETYDEPEWIQEFEQETGIKVNATNVGSPAEMFSKVKANPSQYDIILNTAGWFPQYVESELLEPIDTSKVTEMKNIKLGFPWEEATTVDGKLYGVIYNWGTQPLAVMPELVKGVDLSKYENSKGELDDWNVLWDPALKGKVSLFDDPTSAEPMIPMALGYKDAYNLDEEEFEGFENKLMELRPQVKRLTSGFDDQTAQLAAGEASVAMLNNVATATALKEEGKEILVSNIVKGGMPAWSDNLTITKEGASKEAAVYQFINFSLTPHWQARFIAKSGNSGTLNYEQATTKEAESEGLTKEKLEGTLIPETQKGAAFFNALKFYQPVENLEKRLNLWNEFKLGIGG